MDQFYHCSLCRQTVDEYDLTVHLLMHLEGKLGYCNVCVKGFDTVKELIKHLLRHLKNILHVVNGADPDVVNGNKRKVKDGTGGSRRRYRDEFHINTDVASVRKLSYNGERLSSTESASAISSSQQYQSFTISKAATEQLEKRVGLSDQDAVRAKRRKAVDETVESRKRHRDTSTDEEALRKLCDHRKESPVSSSTKCASLTSTSHQFHPEGKRSRTEPGTGGSRKFPQDETHANNNVSHSTNSANAVSTAPRDKILSKDNRSSDVSCKSNRDKFQIKKDVSDNGKVSASSLLERYQDQNHYANSIQPPGSSGVFRCNICNRLFHTPHLLKQHIATHKDANRCDFCGMDFNSADDRKKHMKPECKICGDVFICEGLLSTHTASRSCEIKYTCEVCNESFPRKEALIIHKQCNHRAIAAFVGNNIRKPWRCGKCFQTFATSEALAEHLKTHFVGNSDVNAPSQNGGKASDETVLCENQHGHLLSFLAYFLGNDVTDPWKCGKCYRNFESSEILAEHLKDHFVNTSDVDAESGDSHKAVDETGLNPKYHQDANHTKTDVEVMKTLDDLRKGAPILSSANFASSLVSKGHQSVTIYKAATNQLKTSVIKVSSLDAVRGTKRKAMDETGQSRKWHPEKIQTDMAAEGVKALGISALPAPKVVDDELETDDQESTGNIVRLKNRCVFCKETFSNEEYKREHGEAECNICGDTFVCKTSLLAHRVAHSSKKRQKKKHEKTGKEPVSSETETQFDIKCHRCGLKFDTYEELQIHTQGHEHLTYFCNYCGKSFFRGFDEQEHCNVKCKICETEFGCKILCKAHEALKTCHEVRAQREIRLKEQECHRREQLTCKNCRNIFASDQVLRKHSYHCYEAYKQTVTCSICKSQFATASELGEHMTTCIPPCENCKTHFSTLSAVREHSKSCFRSCKDCRSTFQTVSELRQHSSTCVRTCKYCRATFPTVSELREHSKTCVHPCQYCGFKFESESEKQKHSNANCMICGTWFICSGYLVTHYTESHNGESPPLRKVQEKCSTFRQVQEKRHELPTYFCNYCKMTFFRGIEKREHSNAKCKFCNTKFDCKSQCTAHEAVHEECRELLAQKEMLLKKERERYQREHLTCKNCRNTFASKEILEVHSGHCYKGMEQTYKCTVCKSRYRTVSELGEHMKTCIPPCEYCNYHFSTFSELREHSKTCFRSCTYCKSTFPTVSELREHLETCINASQSCGVKFESESERQNHINANCKL